jgi:hypothetical protein
MPRERIDCSRHDRSRVLLFSADPIGEIAALLGARVYPSRSDR